MSWHLCTRSTDVIHFKKVVHDIRGVFNESLREIQLIRTIRIHDTLVKLVVTDIYSKVDVV